VGVYQSVLQIVEAPQASPTCMGAKTGEASPASRPLPLVEMIAIIGLSLICGQFGAFKTISFGRDRIYS
jgi:hypothetical protein